MTSQEVVQRTPQQELVSHVRSPPGVVMRSDPPVRPDGRCAHCGEPRMVPRHHSSINPAVYELDPFCSGPCARAYHGNPLPTMYGGDPNEKRGRHERAA